MIEITRDQLQLIVPAIPQAKVDEYRMLLLATLAYAKADTPARAAMLVANVVVECNSFKAFEENLNYSAEALLATWPHRYTPELAREHARQPEVIANHVYAGRVGNGDEASGDGWKFRGRGAIQCTFKDNYRTFGRYLGGTTDYVLHPELVAAPSTAFRTVDWYWSTHALNQFADARDVKGCRKAINGGFNGLDAVRACYDRACAVLRA